MERLCARHWQVACKYKEYLDSRYRGATVVFSVVYFRSVTKGRFQLTK